MEINNFKKEKFLLVMTIVTISLIMLNLGIIIGRKEGTNSCLWLEKYFLNFGGPRVGFREKPFKDFVRSHGIFGEIIKINDNSLVLRGKDDLERVVLLSSSTILKFKRQSISINDLKTGDNIVVIGQPNENGQVNAKFIRLFR